MKWFIVFLLLIGCSRPKDTDTITDYARIGIEAGLNACLVNGKPTTRAELDQAREFARTLVEKMYPEVKFDWPVLQEHEPERRWDNADVPGADVILCSPSRFNYSNRPLVVWGYWTPVDPMGAKWRYVRTVYGMR